VAEDRGLLSDCVPMSKSEVKYTPRTRPSPMPTTLSCVHVYVRACACVCACAYVCRADPQRWVAAPRFVGPRLSPRLELKQRVLGMSESEQGLKKKTKMWEQLKKDARKLEGELEMKLSHYSRLSSGMDAAPGPSDSARSLQGTSQIHSDIASLLKRLEEVHSAMEGDVSGSDIRHHTVTRHREILHDFSQEFRRLSVQINQVSSRCR
jgi:hypothetical protein